MAGNRYLLDTNAVIALQKQDPALAAILAQSEDVFVPSIAIGELYFGAYKSGRPEQNRQAVAAFASERVILQVDSTTGDLYGQIKSALRAKGRPIPENDIWIAALALQYDLILLATDAHFDEVENLQVKTW